ncbi:GntR family transcriptional regulator [soil metagenome]
MAKLFRESAVPLYQQLAEAVIDRLDTGTLQPGSKTSELEMMSEFGVSRMTVRKAFDQLEGEGLILRVPGKGTFIAEPRKLEPQSALTSFSENMKALGMTPGHSTRTVEEVAAPLDVAQHLGIGTGVPVLHIDRLLLADGMSIAVMDAYLPQWVYRGVGIALFADHLDTKSMYSLIEEDCGVRMWKARETVECSVAGDDAQRLELTPESMVLSVRRLTVTQENRPAEYTHLRYRSDLYRYQVELYRNGVQPMNHRP